MLRPTRSRRSNANSSAPSPNSSAPIRERQREGIDLAKARGVYKGRARRLTDEQIAHVRQAAAAGDPKAKLAADLGVSRRLIYDVIAGNGSEVLTAHVLEP